MLTAICFFGCPWRQTAIVKKNLFFFGWAHFHACKKITFVHHNPSKKKMAWQSLVQGKFAFDKGQFSLEKAVFKGNAKV